MKDMNERERQLGDDLEKQLLRVIQSHPSIEHPAVTMTVLCHLLMMVVFARYGKADVSAVRQVVDGALDVVEVHMRQVEGEWVQ